MSKFFIERPILANVIAIVTILLGAVCLYTLPVAQYPQIVPPDHPGDLQLRGGERRGRGQHNWHSDRGGGQRG